MFMLREKNCLRQERVVSEHRTARVGREIEGNLFREKAESDER